MIDYGNGVDIPLSTPIIYREICYILSFTTYQGYLFTYFPINKSQIDIQKIKEHSYLLSSMKILKFSVQFYCTFSYSSDNLDAFFGDFIGILCRLDYTQMAIMHFNSASSSFEMTSKMTTNLHFYIFFFNFYNSTLVYIWGNNDDSQLCRYILIFDTLKQTTKQIYVNYSSLVWLSFLNGNIISEVIDLASGRYSIQKTNLDFESTNGCNPFQKDTFKTFYKIQIYYCIIF